MRFMPGASAAGISGTIPAANFGGTYGNVVNFNNGADSFDGTFYGMFYGASFIGGNFVGDFIGSGSGLGDVWHTGGNSGTTAGLNFVGHDGQSASGVACQWPARLAVDARQQHKQFSRTLSAARQSTLLRRESSARPSAAAARRSMAGRLERTRFWAISTPLVAAGTTPPAAQILIGPGHGWRRCRQHGERYFVHHWRRRR